MTISTLPITLIANGDLRLSANQSCWAEQNKMERSLIAVIESMNYRVIRAHEYDAVEKHGFISSQRQGMDVSAKINRKSPLIVAEAVWQYSHHVLHGLISHEGPILTVANWSGKWPGLVGMLNLNVAYAENAEQADLCLAAKAELARKLGLEVYVCGTNSAGVAQ